jgi:hypothetical protein
VQIVGSVAEGDALLTQLCMSSMPVSGALPTAEKSLIPGQATPRRSHRLPAMSTNTATRP